MWKSTAFHGNSYRKYPKNYVIVLQFPADKLCETIQLKSMHATQYQNYQNGSVVCEYFMFNFNSFTPENSGIIDICIENSSMSSASMRFCVVFTKLPMYLCAL